VAQAVSGAKNSAVKNETVHALCRGATLQNGEKLIRGRKSCLDLINCLRSAERLQAFFGLQDADEAQFATEDSHGFKERRRVFASADGDPDGLEGLRGFQTQVRCRGSKCLVELIVI